MIEFIIGTALGTTFTAIAMSIVSYNKAPHDIEQQSLSHIASKVTNSLEDVEAWELIKDAADKSPWMPKDYYINELVYDLCEFLKNRKDPR